MGVLGLLGGNELNPPCRDFDEALLEAAGRPAQVHIVPTALHRSGSPQGAIAQAAEYFEALNVEVVEVPLLRRSEASDPDVVAALRASRCTYILGGDPGYLLDTLEGSPAVGAMAGAFRDGGAVAGSSAGAMVLCECLLFRGRDPRPTRRRGREALGWLAEVLLIPHLERFGAGWLESARREAPGCHVLGLDECTGAVFDGEWRAYGPGEVKLWTDRGEVSTSFRQGNSVPLSPPVPRP